MARRRRRTRRARLDVAGTAHPRTVLLGHFPEGRVVGAFAPGATSYELYEFGKNRSRKIGKKRKRKTAHDRSR